MKIINRIVKYGSYIDWEKRVILSLREKLRQWLEKVSAAPAF